MGYDYGYTYGDASSLVNTTMAISGTLAIITMLISIAVVVFMVIVLWKIFTKAGKEGWRAIIPFYNTYTLFEITWGNGWYFLLLLLGVIPFLGWIAMLVVVIMTMIKLAKAFGKSDGFIVGLILLCPIFMAILAFDDSKYLGVPNKENTNNANTQPVNNYNAETGAPIQATPIQEVFCRNCGTKFDANSAFCPNCGTPKN